MRVKPLGANQGLASGSGSYYPVGPATGLLLLLLTLYRDRTSEVHYPCNIRHRWRSPAAGPTGYYDSEPVQDLGLYQVA